MTIEITTSRGTENSFYYYGWVVLSASIIGMLLSSGVLLFASFGLFVSHFEAEFGWTRSQIMLALTINTMATVISAPLCGRLIDKYGVRKVLLPSIIIFTVILVLIPKFTGSLMSFYFIIFMLGFFTVGTQSISYIRVLLSWFDEKRGLAIGFAASGLGLSYMITPLVVQFAIEHLSWRQAYNVLAVLVFVIALPLAFFFIKSSDSQTGGNKHDTSNGDKYGVTVKQAVSTREFWLISLAIMLFSFMLTGLIPHIVPMMKESGMTAMEGAKVASIMGLSTFGGRIGAGYLVDKIFAPYVAIMFFGCSAIGLFMLATGVTGGLVFVAALLLGLGFGAESDLIGYFVSRYFGLKFFGVIYGYIYGAFLIGAGLGPLFLGYGYQYFGGYSKLMLIFAVLAVFGCSLFLLLRPFPEFNAENESLKI